MSIVRLQYLRRVRARREKLAKLRRRYGSAQNEEEKAKILAKAELVAPWLSDKEFLAPLAGK